MLSIMEQPPVDPLPRPTVDGASDAVDASKASSLPGTQEAAVKDSNGAQNGVESISGDADSTSKPSAAAASGGDAGSDVASGDANSDSGVKESQSKPAANGLDPVCSVDTAVTHHPVTKPETDDQSDTATISDTKVPSSTAAMSDCDAPIVVPDSDTSAEAGASESLNVSRSELDETREELELRLSGSEGSDPAPEDEDLLLRDDPELVGSPVKEGPVCSSPRPTEDGPKNSTPTPTAGDDTPAAADKAVDKDEPASTDQPSEPVSVSPQSPDPSTANPSASSSPSKPSSPASASSKPTSPSKPSSPSQAAADPSAEAGADAVMADTGEVKSSEGDASQTDAAEADAGDEDEAQSSADPVDLPDDMFESAAALNAAEEEEERVRREAKLLERRRAALLTADSMDSNGDSMDVDDALPPADVGDETSMDVPDGNDDVTLDVPDEVTLDGPEDSVDPESSMPSSAAGGDDDDPDDPAEVDDGGDAEDTAAGSGGDVDTPDIQLDSEDANDATSNDHEVVLEDAEDSPRPEDSRGAAEDSRGAAEDSRDVSESPAASRKRPPSPLSASEGSKMRRLETSTRPFIAVKKVQLNENNLRILQESQERDRLRLEESAAASAASGSSVSSASPPATAAAPAPSAAAAGATSGAAVNGVKSSLLQRVKQLTREDLETLVLEKMCEAIASRSVIGDMKKSAEKHVVAAERFQKKITHLQKQVGDLHLVVRKLSAELKSRKAPSYPVKITRTVGLQVTLAKSVPPLTSRPRPPPSSPGAPTGGAADSPAGAPVSGAPTGAPAGVPVTNGVLRAHLTSTSPIRARQVYSRSPVPQGQVQFRTAQPQSPSHSYRGARRGRPPGVTPSPVSGTTVALVPVVRTMVPIGSVSLPGISSSPQRTVGVAPAAAAAGVPKSPPVYANARGRPAGGHPPRPGASLAGGGGGGAADVVDLTDDDDPKRPTAATGRGTPVTSPRRGGITSVTPVTRVGAGMTPIRLKHPAPFPVTPPNPAVHTGQLLPPPPLLKVTRRANGIVLSWNMELTSRHATVVSYHLFAYQEAGPVNLRANPWKKVGDVRALPLPMACTLTQFQEGHKYHFAVRAEDSFRRRGPFSNPSSIALIGS
ncbi:activating transcription factor 7-interacting protein 1-like [Amphibalanus amphitrite]|uniref:activating transcription factor 7-interacting protein 1-like n=1 Tax=Amphibalanus amphitrite TaxID=1232801 RepID=UPI001C9177D9|nr:activating transcription factor 7-interacting protein 1-like [Amphibalanus amphitrite]XP_043205929.1 activating transcription factor 7-interacting protein 1-like [Amphibalanus amphitrite]